MAAAGRGAGEKEPGRHAEEKRQKARKYNELHTYTGRSAKDPEKV